MSEEGTSHETHDLQESDQDEERDILTPINSPGLNQEFNLSLGESDEEFKALKEKLSSINISDDEKRLSVVLSRTQQIEQKILATVETYRGKAVQLYKNHDGKYYLDKNAMTRVFKNVEDKLIAIYTIAGKYRSGKSFMLANSLKYLIFGQRRNWLDIKTTESFKYENCEERVTTGIWIWPEPIMKKTADGRDVAVFLMDTQGWHDEHTSNNENAMIFALSAVLSSVMIFNAEKRIGEDDLNYLQNFSTTAKLIDPQNKDEPFQKLIFLIRDWQYPKDFNYGYYDDNTSVNGKNFKTTKLNPQPKQSLEAKSIRETIMSTYTDIEAYLMPYPGNWVASDEFSINTANAEFVYHLKKFIAGLFANNAIIPKKIGGQYVTGKDLINNIDNWADEFKYAPKSFGEKLATYIFQQTDETPYLLAYQTALDYFDEKMKKILSECNDIEDYQDLKDAQVGFIRDSKSVFYVGKNMRDAAIKKRFENKLFGELDDRMNIYLDIIDKQMQLKALEISRLRSERNSLDNMSESSLKEEIDVKVTGFQQNRRENRKGWFKVFVGNVAEAIGWKSPTSS